MYFYVDESGHTGNRLFDLDQPVLYYGVLVAQQSLETAEDRVAEMRSKLGVSRLHANQLGLGELVKIAPEMIALCSDLAVQFDVYRVNKSDLAVTQFFDQVFDSGMNSAVPWIAYWTPRRYFILLDLALLFDDPLRKSAWEARIDTDDERAAQRLVVICKQLLKRIGRVGNEGTRRVIRRALAWARDNPKDISYNIARRSDAKQISPNIIGFQFVMHGIAKRVRETGVEPSAVIVDRQGEFNGAQKILSEFYAQAAGVSFEDAPGVMELDFDGMPQIPISFVPGDTNCGLEVADILLWLFKRFFEKKSNAAELEPLISMQMGIGNTDELSLTGIKYRISNTVKSRPELFRG